MLRSGELLGGRGQVGGMISDFGQPGGSEGNWVPGWWGNKCIRKWEEIRFTCFKKLSHFILKKKKKLIVHNFICD